MKVFQIKTDHRFPGFRYLGRCQGRDLSHGVSRADAAYMVPLPMYFEKTKLKPGDFAYSFCGGYALDSRACEVLRPILEQSCELLPLLPHEEETFHLLNVLEIVDCMDEEGTRFAISKATGHKTIQIEKYQFAPDRFSESPLFKLPRRVGLLTVTGLIAPELEFKTIVEREGLTGLKFEELWSESV